MAARFLTDEEYAALAKNAGADDSTASINQCRQVHRLLADGHKPEDLTLTEQRFAASFKDLTLVQVPNDYGWEPAIEEVEAEPKPKKPQKRSE